MTRNEETAAWMGGAFLVALGVGLLVLFRAGHGARGMVLATQSVARVAFAFFWLTYAGGALPVFFGKEFEGVARRRRAFGLAFATALSVHLTFVAWLFHILILPPVSNAVIFYFGIGAAFAYALALGSVSWVRAVMGEWLWRILSIVGLEYIALLFFRDFYLLPHYGGRFDTLFYDPFAFLIVIGALLRWGAMLRRRFPGVPSRSSSG